MRRWILLALILLLLSLTWPVLVGGQVAGTLAESHAVQLGEVSLRHEMTEYRRGYLQARGRSELTVDDGEIRMVIPLRHEIRHGVLGARGASQVDLGALEAPEDSWVARLLRSLELQMETRAGLGGGVTVRMQFESLQQDLREIPEVAAWIATGSEAEDPLWLNLGSGQGRFAWSSDRILLSLDLETLELEDARQRVLLRAPRYVSVFEADEEGRYGRLPDYELGLSAAALDVADEMDRIHATRPRLNVLQRTQDDHLDSYWRLQVDAWSQHPVSGTTALELEALDLQAAALGWYRPAVLEWIADLETLEAHDLARDQRAALFWISTTDAIQQMIEYGPTLRVQGSFNREPERQVLVDAELGLHGDAGAFRARPLETLRLDSGLRLGLEWVAQIEASWPEWDLDDRLHALAAQGWLSREAEAGYWKARLDVNEARVYVNGHDRTNALLALLFAWSGGMF